MRFWITLFALAVFAGGACLGVALDRSVLAQAQAPAPEPWSGWSGNRSGELSVHRFASELGLSDEQDRDLDHILEETHREVGTFSKAMRRTHEQSREAVMKILTAEQKKKLDDLLAAERKARADREQEKSVRLYASLLALNEAQAKTVAEAIAESRQKRRDFFSGSSGRTDWSQARDFFRKLREQQNRRIQPALSEDQFKRYTAIQELMER